MKVQTTEAQAWWIALPDEIRPVRGIDGPKIAAGLNEIFRFPQPPTDEKGGGAVFSNGRLDDILIPRLAVYNDGVNVNVPTDTSDAERVLARVLEFFFALGVRPPVTPPVQFFVSIIVADFDKAIDNLLPSNLLKKITAAMSPNGESSILSIATNYDARLMDDPRWAGLNPTNFKIERRAGTPYALNRYFCLANMTTQAHLDILQDFEDLAGGS